MANLSQEKRERMLAFLNKVKDEHKDDDEMLVALGEIENELNAKKYGLVWEKHEEEVDRMMQDNIPVFTEIKEREIKTTDENSYNFLLEGDNLHSLKLLEKTHAGKIDVIYIDPPYNTGGKNDFIYDDRRIDNADSFRHSKWCSFISRRLEIAKCLLSEKGLIFISIDDNEYANLKLLCDTIFGEHNFIATCVWQKIHSTKNDAKYLSVNHDYILMFAKQIENIHINLLERTEEMNARYKNPDNDPRGAWQSGDLVANEVRLKGNYDVIGPTGIKFNVPVGKHWVYSETNMKKLIADNRIWFGKNGTSFPRKKRFLSEVQSGRTPNTWWENEEVGHNQEGARDLKKILGVVALNNPKPVRLIKRILQISSQQNATVLDFFAGSGTTAQAVLELNKEDGGNRKFILCTNNENNICEEVTYERIKSVIHGYADVEGIPANLKYFKTDFIAKDADDVSSELLEHIKAMVELENGITLDNKHYLIVLSDEQADELAKNWSNYKDVKAIYVSRNVLFTSEQNALFSNTDIHIIPDYYFEYELKEIGETW